MMMKKESTVSRLLHRPLGNELMQYQVTTTYRSILRVQRPEFVRFSYFVAVVIAFFGALRADAQFESEMNQNSHMSGFESIVYAVSIDGKLSRIPKLVTMSAHDALLPKSQSLIGELLLESVRKELRIGDRQHDKLRLLVKDIRLPDDIISKIALSPKLEPELKQRLEELDVNFTTRIFELLSDEQVQRVEKLSLHRNVVVLGLAAWLIQFDNVDLVAERSKLTGILNHANSEFQQEFAAFRIEAIKELSSLLNTANWTENLKLNFHEVLTEDPVLICFQLSLDEPPISVDELVELFEAGSPRYVLSMSSELQKRYERLGSASVLLQALLYDVDVIGSQNLDLMYALNDFRAEAGPKLERDMEAILERVYRGDPDAVKEAEMLLDRFQRDECNVIETTLLAPQRKSLRAVGLVHAIRTCGPWNVVVSFKCSENSADDEFRKQMNELRLRQLTRAMKIVESNSTKVWGAIRRDCPVTAKTIQSAIGEPLHFRPMAQLLFFFSKPEVDRGFER